MNIQSLTQPTYLADGAIEGNELGCSEGEPLVEALGVSLGAPDGTSLGVGDGWADGWTVG